MTEPIRILIVEDLPTDVELAQREIRKILPDCRFVQVDHEEAFLEALRDFQPDLILSDYAMPRFDGMRALSLAIEHAPDIPFIVMTGSTKEETAVACMKAGAWDYVIKEHIKRLGPAVVSAIEQRNVRREKYRAEQALAESEELFRNLFQRHTAFKFIIDPDTGRIVDVNDAAVAFYGWSREEMRKLRIQDLNTLPEDEVRKRMEEVRNRRQAYFEFQHRRADGSIRDVQVFSSRIDVKGKAYLHSIVADITERKQLEAERERLMTAIQQLGEIIIITDTAGRILFVNQAFETVTGFSREEALGQTPRILKSGVQDETFYKQLWETITHGRRWQGRIVNRKKDGTLYTEAATITPVKTLSGKTTHYVAVKRDISEHLELEAKFQQAQKLEAIGRLAGGVAHDYNNMINVILGYAQMAMAETDTNSRLQEYLEQVMGAARRSAEITRQLLAFARKQTIQPEVISLNASIEKSLRMLQRLIGENIELAWLPGKAAGNVYLDAVQLEQVLANLCVNARDAILDVGKITIETDRMTIDEDYCKTHPEATQGDYAVLEVSDNGCGMSPDVLKRIFEPFFTTKEVGKGTGLGLASVYGIVRQNRGFINVYSEPGKGTTFRIYFPRREEPGQIVETNMVAPTKGKGERILVVEDEPMLMEVTREILKAAGYVVVTATRPEEALQIVSSDAIGFELLITDVVLPEMNGKELATRIQEHLPDIRILFMSGYTANAISHFGILDKNVDFIQKPFSIASLTAKVRSILDR
ncbi:MAG: PAS domain S-box protein [Thermodesulfobacteriota bacterium]